MLTMTGPSRRTSVSGRRHRLLPQTRGFEGVRLAVKDLATDRFAVAHVPQLKGLLGDPNTARPANPVLCSGKLEEAKDKLKSRSPVAQARPHGLPRQRLCNAAAPPRRSLATWDAQYPAQRCPWKDARTTITRSGRSATARRTGACRHARALPIARSRGPTSARTPRRSAWSS